MTHARDRLLREDAETRRLAHTDFERPMAIEAGAGTGKTAVLVARVVGWCLGSGWERAASAEPGASDDALAVGVARGVVAITFTEAAAAEMGRRLAGAFLAVERGTPPLGLPRDALPAEASRRARALCGALDQLRIQTIHAFCRRLLVTYPLEAGVHPRLEVDPEGEARDEAVREAIEERIARDYPDSGSDALRLAALGWGPGPLAEALADLVDAGFTAADLAEDPLSPERLAELHRRARAACDGFAAAASGFAGIAERHLARRAFDAVANVRSALGESAWPDRGALEAFVASFRDDLAGHDSLVKRLEAFAEGELNATEAKATADPDALRSAAAELAPLVRHLGELEPETLAVGRVVLRDLLAEVERRLHARGVASFAELLRAASELLRERPDVAARERARIDQLLVDEFQDTDRMQCELLRSLALAGEAGARPVLFLVGDRKQSIYGWRSADLAAYEAFVDDLKAAGGVEGRLSKNYRSVPEILAEVERAIDPVMRREPQVQPEFQPLLPVREAPHAPLPERCAAIEYWVPALRPVASGEAAKTRRRDAVEIEATALAHDLRALHAGGGVAWKDVAVLFRARGDFETYLEALRAAGIPYAVEGDRSYFRRREIIDAAALVRCVAEPNDHLALLTVLRSALGGVPDAALLPLWAHDLAGRVARLEDDAGDELSKLRELAAGVARELPRDVPGIGRIAGWEQNAAALWAAIARLRRSLREDPPDVFVERLRTLTLLDATEAGRFLGRLRTANLERFWRELAAALAGEGGVHALLRLLRRAVASERERAESRPAEAAEDAVRVMTIHAAKGLDFRHVYLMQLDKEPPPQANERAISGRVRPGAPLEFRLLGAPTPGFDRVARERERVAEAERVRALYVAMTRAKDRLVLSGLWPDAGSKRKRSFTALLAERRDPAGDPAARMQALAAEGASDRADAGCVRWVFPSLAAAAEAEVVPPPAADAVWPPLERIEADSLRLASAREAARAREARPFAGTASAAAEETLADVAERRYGERGGALAPRDEGASAACEDGATPSSGGAPPAGGVARAVGTAIHRALEELDLAADPEAELARASEALAESVRSLAAPGAQDEAIAAARELLARIGRGALFARLRALGAGELHRELPVLLPPEAERGAVGFVAGVIDLVYRDPGTGRLVVADYKTDRAANDAQIVEHARHYAPQGAVYQRALREALALDYTPRFELWLLDADRVAVVSE